MTNDAGDDPTMADRIAGAGDAPAPGHPAADAPPVPSAGAQLSHGGEELAVVGDDQLLARNGADDDDGTAAGTAPG